MAYTSWLIDLILTSTGIRRPRTPVLRRKVHKRTVAVKNFGDKNRQKKKRKLLKDCIYYYYFDIIKLFGLAEKTRYYWVRLCIFTGLKTKQIYGSQACTRDA